MTSPKRADGLLTRKKDQFLTKQFAMNWDWQELFSLVSAIGEEIVSEVAKADQAKVDRLIIALANNPRPPGCVKLSGPSQLWRIRSGDYRIVYEILDQQLVVVVVIIAHRREVYRGL